MGIITQQHVGKFVVGGFVFASEADYDSWCQKRNSDFDKRTFLIFLPAMVCAVLSVVIVSYFPQIYGHHGVFNFGMTLLAIVGLMMVSGIFASKKYPGPSMPERI